MAALTMKELLEAGVHFGHQTKRWNPKMQKYIFGERNGIYIIDLQKTLKKFREAYGFVRDLAAGGGTVLFIGTKKQAQETVFEEASRCGMFYVNQRWLGGTLTNFATIRKSITRLKKLEEMKETGEFERVSKKEALELDREREKLEKALIGIKIMDSLPSSVFIIVPVALVAVGSGSFLAFVFAAIVGVFMAFCWAELSAAFPIAAGDYALVWHSFKGRTSWLAGPVSFVTFALYVDFIAFIPAVIALGTGTYLAVIVNVNLKVIGAVVMLPVTGIFDSAM